MLQTIRKLQLAIRSFSLNSCLHYTSFCQVLCIQKQLPRGITVGPGSFVWLGKQQGLHFRAKRLHGLAVLRGTGLEHPDKGRTANQTCPKHCSKCGTAGSRQSMRSSTCGYSCQQLVLGLLRMCKPCRHCSWLPRHRWHRQSAIQTLCPHEIRSCHFSPRSEGPQENASSKHETRCVSKGSKSIKRGQSDICCYWGSTSITEL